ncbi:hypothetical protein Rs2_33295 [Raphanus sativus]|nr:hypothetical protein Rs2_33295 [Raphanus sativus]
MDFTKRILMVFALTIMLGISFVQCRQNQELMSWSGKKFTQCFDSGPCRKGLLKCIEFCSSMGTANGQCNIGTKICPTSCGVSLFDGFLDLEHRKRVCILALLNRIRGLETSVPNLDQVAGLFTTLPWQLEIIPDNAGNWLFFKTPPSRYTSMNSDSNRAIW